MTPAEPSLRAAEERAPSRFPAAPSILLLTVSLAAAAAACGRVPGQFEILQNQVPQPGCVIPAEAGNLYRGDGTLDLSLVQAGSTSAYYLFPLVKNNLPGSTGDGPDPNEIDIKSFAVDISPHEVGSVPPGVRTLFDTLNASPGSPDYGLIHYALPWAVTVASGGGLAATSVGAFPVGLASRILATGEVGTSPSSMLVNIRVRIFGDTNTQSIESDPFDYPVYVCNGCLVANLAPCPYPSPPRFTGNECNVAQDSFVDCCSLNGALVCPPLVSGL
jgi:hypothetical protein